MAAKKLLVVLVVLTLVGLGLTSFADQAAAEEGKRVCQLADFGPSGETGYFKRRKDNAGAAVHAHCSHFEYKGAQADNIFVGGDDYTVCEDFTDWLGLNEFSTTHAGVDDICIYMNLADPSDLFENVYTLKQLQELRPPLIDPGLSSKWLGGNGGTKSALSCDGEPINAINIWAGRRIDSLQFQCMGEKASEERQFGGDGGGNVPDDAEDCDSHLEGDEQFGVVTGIKGRSGSRIDQLQIVCSYFTLSEEFTFPVYGDDESVRYAEAKRLHVAIGEAQGGNGGSRFSQACTEGKYVRKVDIRHGAGIDGVRIYCSEKLSNANSLDL